MCVIVNTGGENHVLFETVVAWPAPGIPAIRLSAFADSSFWLGQDLGSRHVLSSWDVLFRAPADGAE